MNRVKVAGAVASTTGATLYLDTGKTVELRNTDSATQSILEELARVLKIGETVEIDLDDYSVYKIAEKKTGGVLSFISTKSKEFLSMFGKKAVKDNQREQLVGVINGTFVPDVEKIERYIAHAVKQTDMKGFQRFMERIARGPQHNHVASELLEFMSRGDLPIADDGCIVAYKVLTTGYAQHRNKGYYVDCHTHRVTQRLGSRVYMAENLVDPSRRKECSTGLHIARRGYLGQFGGDIITLVKIAPEDVICVPEGEPNKMRVRAYHIVGVIPQHMHEVLRANRPMTADDEAARLLADVLKGNHVGILEEVEIAGPSGGNVTVRPVGTAEKPIVQGNNGKGMALDYDTNGIAIAVLNAEIAKKRMSEEIEAMPSKPEPVVEPIAAEPEAAPVDPAPEKAKVKKVAKPKVAEREEAKPKAVATPLDDATAKQRMADVLRLVGEGKTYQQVGDELGISARTVRRTVAASRK